MKIDWPAGREIKKEKAGSKLNSKNTSIRGLTDYKMVRDSGILRIAAIDLMWFKFYIICSIINKEF